jgi:NACalpha-BTF3-like transcription factor
MSATAPTPPSAGKAPTLEEFVTLHSSQLEAMKIPKLLWKVVHRKLFAPKFIHDEDLFELEHLESGGYQLKAKKALRKNGDIYIIPHAAEGTDQSLFDLLKSAPPLTQYLAEMVDLDLITVTPEDQAEKRKELIEKTKLMISTAKEQKNSRLDGIDEEMIATVMEQAEVTRARAEDALIESSGDLVAAIADCLMTPEYKALEQNMNKNLFSQQAQMKGEDVDFQDSYRREQEYKNLQEESAKAEALLSQLEALDLQEKTRAPQNETEKYLQRVAHLYQALFKNHFVGVYYSMKPRPDGAEPTPISPDEVVKNFYVMENMGSAIVGSKEPNVSLECLICLSSGNTSWTVMWPTRDIKAGDVIYRGALVPVPCPLDFKW